jgi:hypothetical protein
MANALSRFHSTLARRPGRLIAGIGLACAVAYGLSLLILPKAGGRVVVGDAVHYFVYLRSLVFDRDLHFQNEYFRLYGLDPAATPPPDTEWVYIPLPSGYTRNVMPIGTAIAWAPLYLCVTVAAYALHLVGLAPAPDGYARAFQASAGFSGIVAATGGAWLSFLLARSLFGVTAALWATVAVWLGSSAIYYSLVSPTYSHACSMLATSAALYVWWISRDQRTAARYALVGVLVGCAALVRPQDVVFLAAPLLDTLAELRQPSTTKWRDALVHAASSVAAAVAVFVPQMIVWAVLYGNPLLVPQGSGFMRWADPQLVAVLFSSFRGLFTWTPVLVVAVLGLGRLGSERGHLTVVFVVIFVLSWYVNASVADWWAGEAFGARRFLSCFPIFVVGCAAMMERWRDRPSAIAVGVIGVVLLNGLLLFQYQLFLKGWRDVAPYPDTAWSLWIERFIVPIRVVSRVLGLR